MRHLCTAILLFISATALSQASFTTMGTPYTQDFNSLPNATDGSTLATWTQNSTLPGWYIDEGNGGTCSGTACDDKPIIEASYTTMNNGGNSYIYASGSDRSLGSRAAGSTGTNYIGLRIANNTGSTITSIYIDYYGEQWTIAENQNNINTLTLEYQVGATVTSLTAGSWTATGCDFTQVWNSTQSAGLGGSACGGTSAQCLALDGNLAANRTHVQGCVTVSIPAGDEIMLRWSDINDPANDHHMQLDDITIYPFDVSCAIVLPVEMVSFTAERSGHVALLNWETSSEQNNDYFTVERLNENGVFNQIGIVDGNGTTSQPSYYSFTDETPLPGTNYYRLRQTDYNGDYAYSPIRSVEFTDADGFIAHAWFDDALHYSQSGFGGPTTISVVGEDGRLIAEIKTEEPTGMLSEYIADGVYVIWFANHEGTIVQKLVILN